MIPSLSTTLCPPLAYSPHPSPLYHPIKLTSQCNNSHQPAPAFPSVPTLTAAIRGGTVLSPVRPIQPWISKASAGPCKPLSLTLALHLWPLPLFAASSTCPCLQAHAAAVQASSHSPSTIPAVQALRPDSRPSLRP